MKPRIVTDKEVVALCNLDPGVCQHLIKCDIRAIAEYEYYLLHAGNTEPVPYISDLDACLQMKMTGQRPDAHSLRTKFYLLFYPSKTP